VGDALGSLDTANLAESVRPDGVIVKPDVPLAPIDQCYVNDANVLKLPMVAATYVDHGNLRAAYVFAYAQTSAATNSGFIPSELGISGSAYVYDFFNSTGLVVAASNTLAFTTSMPSNNVNGSYFVVVPVGPSGIALVGDTNKFVTVGNKRLPALADAGVVKATVSFALGETNVTLAGYAPSLPCATALSGAVGGMAYNSMTHLFSLNVAPDSSQTATLALSLTPLPVLQITNLWSNLRISWPTSAVGYQLEGTASLKAPANWGPLTNPVSVSGAQNSVIVTPSGSSTFYRLKQ